MASRSPVPQTPYSYVLEQTGTMRVPAIIYADQGILDNLEDKVLGQLYNIASLPGVTGPVMAMPDAHTGYGFPIGGVAAFNPDQDGIVSAGGVGFDIACGVRTLSTGIHKQDILEQSKALADHLFQKIPAGLGKKGGFKVSDKDLNKIMLKGASWAVSQGLGRPGDLEMCEHRGMVQGAAPEHVSSQARERQLTLMGTLGSGNHYLEVQAIDKVHDPDMAAAMGLRQGDCVISIHCGSRGLGHQTASDYIRIMLNQASRHGIHLPDRDLACAPIRSDTGQKYLGAMRAAMNCALANRQILTHLTRQVFAGFFPDAGLNLIYDVSHNTCLEEKHDLGRGPEKLFVHRKGATRALGPGSRELPDRYRGLGQPVIIGGSMGTASYILKGTQASEKLSLSSACHGAGRIMSRKQASRNFHAAGLLEELQQAGIEIRGHSFKGLAEEAPRAYKDVDRVIQVTHESGLASKVARLTPLICVKG